MKIFSAAQIRRCDGVTLQEQSLTETELMERAAGHCAEYLLHRFGNEIHFQIFCGNGNNGGDGLVVARLLANENCEVTVFCAPTPFSTAAAVAFTKVQVQKKVILKAFEEYNPQHDRKNTVNIDALFGTGLNRKVEGEIAAVIGKINSSSAICCALDIPSGLPADGPPFKDAAVVQAAETLSFQFYKRSFLHPESGKYCGTIKVLDIGLSAGFIASEPSSYHYIQKEDCLQFYRPRNQFSHKGTYGKAVLVSGSYGKSGAAVLATRAALRCGSGLTFTAAPLCSHEILQTTCPEAMFLQSGETAVDGIPLIDGAVYGIGPGLGKEPRTAEALLHFLKLHKQPLVLDADALNILAAFPEILTGLPANSVLTPHPKEFSRLFGETENSFQQVELARQKAAELNLIIVLKGSYTQTVLPTGEVYYNSSGTAGMAKGGSGDALTGILTALLAQGYPPADAAVLGVWIHGKAGELAAEKFSVEAMLASDLLEEVGAVFRALHKKSPRKGL